MHRAPSFSQVDQVWDCLEIRFGVRVRLLRAVFYRNTFLSKHLHGREPCLALFWPTNLARPGLFSSRLLSPSLSLPLALSLSHTHKHSGSPNSASSVKVRGRANSAHTRQSAHIRQSRLDHGFDCGTYTRVKARCGPWLSGKCPFKLVPLHSQAAPLSPLALDD